VKTARLGVSWATAVMAMFRAGPSDGWSWSEDASPPIAFCVHVLVWDGLRVPPFDRHPEGDGTLRARGLDAQTWNAWLPAVVAAQGRLSKRVREPEWLADRAGLATLVEAAMTPVALCPGTPELRARLGELWTDYLPKGERWKQDLTSGPQGVRNRLAPGEQRWLWKALVPFHDRLPTLSVLRPRAGEGIARRAVEDDVVGHRDSQSAARVPIPPAEPPHVPLGGECLVAPVEERVGGVRIDVDLVRHACAREGESDASASEHQAAPDARIR
jgi:hypothetical protein